MSSEQTPLHGARVLVVDDDDHVRRALAALLRRAGGEVTALPDAVHALATVARERVDLVVTDLQMPHVDGLELLADVRANHRDVEVVLMTGHATVDVAVRALKLGAYDFLVKPLPDAAQVLAIVRRAAERQLLRRRNQQLEAQLAETAPRGVLVGTSEAMRRVDDTIEAVARYATTVLVLGESGTGKELVARAVHARGPRAGRPWVAVNCSALPEALLESELFGHVKGAFTGAVGTRDGLFQAAHGGTLFLDEVGELPLALQAKLLRAVQESEVRKVGGTAAEKVDVRVVAATNVDLRAAAAAGRFREDLYYRLDVVTIRVPPLRDRAEDIPLLAAHFVRRHAERVGRGAPALTAAALAWLGAQPWRGNVRELENTLERAVVLARGDVLDADAFTGGAAHAPDGVGGEVGGARAPVAAAVLDLPLVEARDAALASFDRAYLEERLARAQGNVSEAARAAGMDRANFRRLLKRYHIDAGKFLRG